MRRVVSGALFLALVLSLFAARAEDRQAQYTAYARVDCHLRMTADAGAYRVCAVKKGEKLTVYEYADKWCFVSSKSGEGYCKTSWLWRFISRRPFELAVPGFVKNTALAVVKEAFSASVDGYAGNDFIAGDYVAVRSYDQSAAILPMMRAQTSVDASKLDITPFADPKSARPGEVIAAFTTYYNDKTGGRLAFERRFNIALGRERLDGTVVKSGETFSFNALCGPYAKGSGYAEGPNISSDGVGWGGGICQLSTTLYEAVLCAPLQVGQWALHRDSGIDYAPQGFDAAVGIYSDFTFTNTLAYDLCIRVLPQDGVCTVLLVRYDENAPLTIYRDARDAQPELPPAAVTDEAAVPAVVNNPQADTLALRDAPSAAARVLGRCYNGVTVSRAQEAQNGYVKVYVGGREGYMAEAYLSDASDAAGVLPTAPALYASDGAALYYDANCDMRLVPLPAGTPILALMDCGQALYARADAAAGYIPLAQTNDYGLQKRGMVRAGTLSLRAEPSDDAEILTMLEAGAMVVLLETGEPWSRVRSGGAEGYVKTRYLAIGD